jgi:hypothetical protein
MTNVVKSQFRWEDVVKTVLEHKGKTVIQIAEAMADKYGVLDEIVDGDELYPSETMWYFTAPQIKREY